MPQSLEVIMHNNIRFDEVISLDINNKILKMDFKKLVRVYSFMHNFKRIGPMITKVRN